MKIYFMIRLFKNTEATWKIPEIFFGGRIPAHGTSLLLASLISCKATSIYKMHWLHTLGTIENLPLSLTVVERRTKTAEIMRHKTGEPNLEDMLPRISV